MKAGGVMNTKIQQEKNSKGKVINRVEEVKATWSTIGTLTFSLFNTARIDGVEFGKQVPASIKNGSKVRIIIEVLKEPLNEQKR